MKLVVALLAAGIAASSPASSQIDPSQADARLIGLPIYTADGVLIGQVTNIDMRGSNRGLVAAVGSSLGFGSRIVLIPLAWANKEEDYIQLLLTHEEMASFFFPGLGRGPP